MTFITITASGRSSMYGDRDRGPRSETSSLGAPSGTMPHDVNETETERDNSSRYVLLIPLTLRV
jgi:hypothetical protein